MLLHTEHAIWTDGYSQIRYAHPDHLPNKGNGDKDRCVVCDQFLCSLIVEFDDEPTTSCRVCELCAPSIIPLISGVS